MVLSTVGTGSGIESGGLLVSDIETSGLVLLCPREIGEVEWKALLSLNLMMRPVVLIARGRFGGFKFHFGDSRIHFNRVNNERD